MTGEQEGSGSFWLEHTSAWEGFWARSRAAACGPLPKRGHPCGLLFMRKVCTNTTTKKMHYYVTHSCETRKDSGYSISAAHLNAAIPARPSELHHVSLQRAILCHSTTTNQLLTPSLSGVGLPERVTGYTGEVVVHSGRSLWGGLRDSSSSWNETMALGG